MTCYSLKAKSSEMVMVIKWSRTVFFFLVQSNICKGMFLAPPYSILLITLKDSFKVTWFFASMLKKALPLSFLKCSSLSELYFAHLFYLLRYFQFLRVKKSVNICLFSLYTQLLSVAAHRIPIFYFSEKIPAIYFVSCMKTWFFFLSLFAFIKQFFFPT